MFFFVCEMFAIRQSDRCLFQIRQCFFKIVAQEEGIFGPEFKVFLFFDETLHFNKFEDADFKCDLRF